MKDIVHGFQVGPKFGYKYLMKDVVYGFQVGPKFGYKLGILGKCLKQTFGKLYMQLGDKFQYTDHLGRFGSILSDKNNKYLLKLIICTSACLCFGHLFQLMCFSRCVSVACILVSHITGSSMELFLYLAIKLTSTVHSFPKNGHWWPLIDNLKPNSGECVG